MAVIGNFDEAPLRGPERAASFRKAAAEQFLARGYARVSINEIIAEAGGSKRDLYAHFGNKEALFRQVIVDICEEVLAPLRALPTHGAGIAEILIDLGLTFVTFVLTPRVVSLQRLMISEAGRYPEFAKVFFDHGPSAAHGVVAGILSRASIANELAIEDPEAAAAIFCNMLLSDLPMRAMAGICAGREEIESRVRYGVRIFLDGVRGEAVD